MARRMLNPFKPLINQVHPTFRNRFWLILSVFILWMLLFDKHDVITQIKLQMTLNRMKQDKIYYTNKLAQVKGERVDMENDKEKFAREHYFMKTADEDIFVVQKGE